MTVLSCNVTMTRISTLVLAFASVAVGIKIDFPSAGDYWVACGYNNLRWTPEANDPSIFSVVLQGTNKTKLNDDYSGEHPAVAWVVFMKLGALT